MQSVASKCYETCSRYSQLWQNTTSWIAFLASLTIYLDTENLATKQEVV